MRVMPVLLRDSRPALFPLALLIALGACVVESPVETAPDFAMLGDDCEGEIDRGGCDDPEPEVPPTGPWTADARWGVVMGVTWSYCTTSSQDADNDGLRDFCEAQLAERFAPRLYFHPGEQCRTREPYYAVRMSDGLQRELQIFYALAYQMDCGAVHEWGGHWGDSEFLVVELKNNGGNVWVTERVYTSAHRGESWGLDKSRWTGWASLSWQDVSGGRARILVSEDKHANFAVKSVCDWSPADDCSWNGVSQPLSPDRILTTALNLGRRWTPLIDCVPSRIRFPASAYRNECFWDTTYRFYGWWLFREGGGATAYGEVLPDFGF